MSLAELPQALNKQLLQGTYETSLSELCFTPAEEVQQPYLDVGQIDR